MRGTEEDGTRKYTDATDDIGQAGWHVCISGAVLSLDISHSHRWKWRQEEGCREGEEKAALLCAEQVIESLSANRMSAAEVIHEPLAGWINPRRGCCY